MEEEKAAAYYDELTRKGEGAARFKQGLGFSSQSSNTTNDAVRGSALPSSSSFLSNFVRASSPGKAAELQRQAQLESIQNKLKKKPSSGNQSRDSDNRGRDGSKYDAGHDSRASRCRSSSRERDKSSRRRSRSRDRHESRRRHRSSSRDKDRERRGERRRSRSPSYHDEGRHRRSSRERRSRGRSRSSSPRDRRSEKSRGHSYKDKGEGKSEKDKNGGIDYSRLVEGYADMTPAERVKAKMKLQLSQTADKDATMGMGAGWERFEFNKDAPLDDEEIEVADDDAALVKHIGQSFRFSAVEARKEEQIKAAHDEAMFGVSAAPPPVVTDKKPTKDNDDKESNQSVTLTNLISDKVLAKQRGSWRDRARKVTDGQKS
ncbi:PREDICTED: serine/threonine-protein kinase fray2 [Nelumbo nucifera]|uniref:Serine/threonine-protein kinase fray2 n=2 Tax=Nelumbo nucifera TaxID=4432 RepID=A0A1U7ZMP4_NELNU|nr:PREDICTED: serine/threonine-protein kinase fray2 [Nelumbo nucifera]DAD34719.1 TPA_asm: hypothetical protein HUJ06_005359 [Nelumbo nucifera]